jgi:hypothetical protein
LRRKNFLVPFFVEYSNDEKVIDTKRMVILKDWELYMQVLDLNDENETAAKYPASCTALFTRRWYPSTLKLGDFVSTPLPRLDRIELARVLTTSSGLPPERIEIAKAPGQFPCEESCSIGKVAWVSLLSHDGSPEFKHPCNIEIDGDVVYWRDKDEKSKMVTKKKRRGRQL